MFVPVWFPVGLTKIHNNIRHRRMVHPMNLTKQSPSQGPAIRPYPLAGVLPRPFPGPDSRFFRCPVAESTDATDVLHWNQTKPADSPRHHANGPTDSHPAGHGPVLASRCKASLRSSSSSSWPKWTGNVVRLASVAISFACVKHANNQPGEYLTQPEQRFGLRS